MSAAAEQHDVDPALEPPVLQAIDAKIAEAEALAGRYRILRRLVAEALELNVGQLPLEGLDLNGAINGHATSEPTPAAPADPGVLSEPQETAVGGIAEAPPGEARPSAGSEDPDLPERQGGGLSTRADSRCDDVLSVIRDNPSGIRPLAIAEALGIHRTSVTPHVNALLDSGEVRAEPDPDDGRARLLFPARARHEPSKPLGPAKRGSADRVNRKASETKAKQDERRIRELVEAAGAEGATPEAIAQAMDIGIASARSKLGMLAGRGLISKSIDEPPVYRAASIGILPADADGAKSEVERKVVAALRRSPVPLTSNEVARNAEIRGNGIGDVLSVLGRRGVLRRIEPEGMGGAVRWEVATA